MTWWPDGNGWGVDRDAPPAARVAGNESVRSSLQGGDTFTSGTRVLDMVGNRGTYREGRMGERR